MLFLNLNHITFDSKYSNSPSQLNLRDSLPLHSIFCEYLDVGIGNYVSMTTSLYRIIIQTLLVVINKT